MNTSNERPYSAVRLVTLFFLVAWGAVLLNAGRLLTMVDVEGPLAWAWALATIVTYAATYLLPVALPALGIALLLDRRAPEAKGARVVVLCGAAILVGAIQVVLFADVLIFSGHGFHLNAFVWNILRTPGGVASLGGGAATEAAAAAISVVLLLLHLALAGLVWFAVRRRPTVLAAVTLRRAGVVLVALVVLGLAERVVYGVADLRGYEPLTSLRGLVPFYKPMTMRVLGRALGLEAPRPPSLRVGNRELTYPRRPLAFVPTPPRHNVVWLVGESLRADMIDPEIMPNTHAFARRAQWFRNHQSGGNGTRMGMFSMFYGLYGAYWFPFKAARRQPLIVEEVLGRGYRVEARTSALFSYPEFDETIWAQFPREHMHTLEKEVATGWDRDAEHVRRMLEFIDQDPSRPFFTFMFFESTHAAYGFPPETAIREPYAEDINYATMDMNANAEPIKARYINAAHWLDIVLGRLFDHLKERGLLDRTIVVVTGDHGEEFFEHGRWGHNSTFSKEQISPPLILWLPGAAPAERLDLSSHLDIAPTVLRALGAKNPTEDFSLGLDLMGPTRRRFNVVCDWYAVVYSDEHDRAVFQLDGIGRPDVFHDDQPVADPGPFLSTHRDDVFQIMKDLRVFNDPRRSHPPQPMDREKKAE